MTKSDCERLLQEVTGGAGQLTPEMLATSGAWATLARMLANLDRSFERRNDTDALAWVSDMRIKVPAAALGDRRQLAGRLATLGRLVAAAEVLEEAARLAPGLPVRDRLLSEASGLRGRLN